MFSDTTCQTESHTTPEDEVWTLTGLELSHDMMFVLRDWTAWPEILRQLEAIGAEIASFSVVAREDAGWLLRCRAKAIQARPARVFARNVHESNLACLATIEHLMVRKAT